MKRGCQFGLVAFLFAVQCLPMAGRANDIHEAIRAGDLPRLEAAVSNMADTGALSERDSHGLTPLALAVSLDNQPILFWVLSRTPCVYVDRLLDSRTEDGQTAVKTGFMAVIRQKLQELAAAHEFAVEPIDFGLGLVGLSLGDSTAAKEAFQRILKQNPGHHRARAELARAFVMAGEPALAKAEIQKAGAHEMTPMDRQILAKCLNSITPKERGPLHSTIRLDLGYLDDSNVNIGPQSEVIGTAPFLFGRQVVDLLLVPEDAQPAGARGVFVAATASGAWDAGSPDQWVWGGDAAYYQNWLEKDRSDNETLFGQISTGPRFIGKQSLFSLPILFGEVMYGGEKLADIYGINPSFLCAAGRDSSYFWTTSLAVQQRDYRVLDGRDSTYLAVGETLRKTFGEAGHSVSVGLTLFSDFADSPFYENSGYIWRMGCQFSLPWRTVLHTSLNYTRSDYRDREDLAPDTRADTQHNLTVGLEKRIVGDWGLDVSFQNVDNNSTFALYQYDRQVWTAGTFLVF